VQQMALEHFPQVAPQKNRALSLQISTRSRHVGFQQTKKYVRGAGERSRVWTNAVSQEVLLLLAVAQHDRQTDQCSRIKQTMIPMKKCNHFL